MTVGKEGIKATIICDSISPQGIRLTTMELEYPRFIHAELMTHRMLSKNCASSRAIPVKKMHDLIVENPAMPVYWGMNQPGMTAKEEVRDIELCKDIWKKASVYQVEMANSLSQLGLHKQITNRITEPWQRMKTVITGTEWANLLWLRNHEDAQPEFGELALNIAAEFERSTPILLSPGQWHLPYVANSESISTENALKLSSSCCAQVSYRNMNDTLEKALDIYEKLVGASRKHASPFEHQGTPADEPDADSPWQTGITHQDRAGDLWSGNFRGWIQHRQTIPNHAVW